MAESQLIYVSPERMGEVLKSAGCRVEQTIDSNGVPVLTTATNGVNFNVRFANRAPAPIEGFLDYTYVTVMKLDFDFPLEKINEWNKIRRFTRLHKEKEFLVMDMDVLAAGGVTETHMLASLEIWDRLLQEMLMWLRAASPTGPANAA
jgi:hypothetical protein